MASKQTQAPQGVSKRELEADYLFNQHLIRTIAYTGAGFGLGMLTSILFKHKAAMTLFFAGTGAGYGASNFYNDLSHFRRFSTMDQRGQGQRRGGSGSRESLESTARDVAGAAKDTAGRAAGAVKDAAGRASGAARDAAESARDTAGKVAGQAKDAAGRAADTARDTAGKVAGQAKDAAGRAADTARDTAGKVAGQARDVAGQAKDAGGRAADSARDTAGKVAGQAKEAAGRATEAARDIAGAAKDKAEHFLHQGHSSGGKGGDQRASTHDDHRSQQRTSSSTGDGHGYGGTKGPGDLPHYGSSLSQQSTSQYHKGTEESSGRFGAGNAGEADRHKRSQDQHTVNRVPDTIVGAQVKNQRNDNLDFSSKDSSKDANTKKSPVPAGPGVHSKGSERDSTENKGGQHFQSFNSNPNTAGEKYPVLSEYQRGRDKMNDRSLDNVRRQQHGLEQDTFGYQSIKQGNNIKVESSSDTLAGAQNYSKTGAPSLHHNQVNAEL